MLEKFTGAKIRQFAGLYKRAVVRLIIFFFAISNKRCTFAPEVLPRQTSGLNMKVLVAPLNWGLGHAARCVPIVRKYVAAGDEVVLGGDGESLLLLRRTFPELRWVPLAPLHLRYDRGKRQWLFYWRSIPQLVRFALADRCCLRALLKKECFDLVVSDNRFGLRSHRTRCVYMTHQLYVRLPQRLRLLQPIARALHRAVYGRFDEVWVPDYASAEHNLSGALSHGGDMDACVRYIGPLSRLDVPAAVAESPYKVVAVLSGLEPQRTAFEQELLRRFAHSEQPVLLVRGKMSESGTCVTMGNVTVVPYMDDKSLVCALLGAERIIVRSGYSTVMDLEHLGLLRKAEWHPTPDQPEQEYLAVYNA